MKEYFKLHNSIIPVSGYNRSILLDVERNEYYSIPNDLIKILNEYNNINDVINNNSDYRDIIQEYFNFLNKNELIIIDNKDYITNFGKLSLTYRSNHFIESITLIIKNNFNQLDNIKQLSVKISSFDVRQLEIRFESNISFRILDNILSIFKETSILSIIIVTPYSKELERNINEIKFLNRRLIKIIFYNSNKIEVAKYGKFNDLTVFYTKKIFNETDVYPSLSLNNLNLNMVTEAVCYNLYYNKKIYIDSDLYISNTVQFENKFSLKQESINTIIKKKSFNYLWETNKDKVDICKDCEFRYVCIDSRIPILIKNLWYYESKCKYNPYIALWEEQENWISVEQWRKENPGWEEKAKANRVSYKTENNEKIF